MLNQPIRILTHFEKISFFFGRLYFSATVRALSIHKLRFRPKGFTGGTIQAFISTFINITLIIKPFKNFLYLLLVVRVSRPNKFIIGSIHQIPQSPDCSGYIIYKFFRCNSSLLCLQLYFLSVFICPCLEKHIIAFFSLVSGNAVCQYDLITVSNVGFPRRIGYRCSNIVFSFPHSLFPFLD